MDDLHKSARWKELVNGDLDEVTKKAIENSDALAHRLADRDLREEQAASLSASPEAQKRVGQIQNLGRILRDHAQDAARSVDSNALWQAIEAQTEAETQGRGAVLGGWKVWGPGAGLLAAAAALALVFIGRGTNPPNGKDPAMATAEPTALPVETTMASLTPTAGSQVESVDFGGQTGTVFEIAGDSGQPLAVVWIDDEE